MKLKKKEAQEKLKELFHKEMEWLRDEYNRVCPEEHWAFLFTNTELRVMDADTFYNAKNTVSLVHGKSYKEIEIWEDHNSDTRSRESPSAVFKINQMNEVIAKIIELMKIQPKLPIYRRYKADNILPLISDLSGGKLKNILEDSEKGRINMALWKDIQSVKKGELKCSFYSLAKKYKVSTATVVAYNKRSVECQKCKEIKVFDAKLYKEMLEKYGSKSNFNKGFICKKCNINVLM
ncbi:hypothetical protein LCGC14_0694310 [marine sediment metagenome]|uniref:Uncharacterized protein n=1 Tax=marine sediment metagenome TaxID=412755 RepID=A0A0F9QPJ3_9ZZZZ